MTTSFRERPPTLNGFQSVAGQGIGRIQPVRTSSWDFTNRLLTVPVYCLYAPTRSAVCRRSYFRIPALGEGVTPRVVYLSGGGHHFKCPLPVDVLIILKRFVFENYFTGQQAGMWCLFSSIQLIFILRCCNYCIEQAIVWIRDSSSVRPSVCMFFDVCCLCQTRLDIFAWVFY